jgi:hypothetical protein
MKLYVPLRRDEFDRLANLARAERRRPQDQAAVLLEAAVREAEARQKQEPALAEATPA